jgi:hypothetical protein
VDTAFNGPDAAGAFGRRAAATAVALAWAG